MLIFLCSALISSMVFLMALASPLAFSSLGPEKSSKFLRDIFPQIFLFGAVLSLLIAIVAIITGSHIFIIIGFICLLYLFSIEIILFQFLISARTIIKEISFGHFISGLLRFSYKCSC